MELTENKYDLTQGSIANKLMTFFFPIAAGTLFQQLYNTVDAVIVGKFVGTAALAAVGGSAAMIITLIINFFVGLASGATVVISQYYGSGEREGIERAVHTAIAFCLVFGAAVTVLGLFLAPWSLRAIHNTPDTMEESIIYLRIYFAGAIPLMLFNMGSGILRAVGDSKRPLMFLIVSCVLNIGLDLLFVTVCKMGVAGVGWATVIALFVSSALTVLTLCKTKESYRLKISKLRFHRVQLSHMLHIGLPAGVQGAMYAGSNIIIQSVINGFGTSVVAAWTATSKLDGVFWAVSNSFGVAIMAFVGQNFGAGKYDRMKKSVRVCLGIAMVTTLALSALLLCFGEQCMHIFVDDPVVIDHAVNILWHFAPFYFVWTFIEVLSNALRGAGDAVKPMIITIVGVCALRIAWCCAVVPFWNTIECVCLCYPFTWAVTAVVFIIYYLRGGWLNRCITRLQEGR